MAAVDQKEKARTIADIARLANVSPSTVSRALSNSPLISAETAHAFRPLRVSTTSPSTPVPKACACSAPRRWLRW